MNDQPDRLTTALAGRYNIEREVGAGGMANVYLAEDVKHHRRVAVKVLRPELAAILGVERFLKETEVTANLQHPHILPLHDSGEADSFLYYVMPYVEGESLRDKLNREKQFGVDETIKIAKEVAAALDYAHERGIVHRDIKPENILLEAGQAVVADFGVALAVSNAGGTRLTETGLSLGTPQYMSPEQATGERELTARSDVYSLGCVVYEMLVGEPPHTGPTAQAIVAKVLAERPRSITAVRDTVPEYLDGAVLTALAKLPADRFRTASDFVSALESGQSGLAYPGTSRRGAQRETKPRRTVTTVQFAAVCVVAVIAAVAAVLEWSRRRASPPNAVTRFVVELPAGQRMSTGPVLSPDGRRLVYGAVGDEGVHLYVREFDKFSAVRVLGTEGATVPFFSPDGEWIGYFADGRLQKVSVTTGASVTITDVAEVPAGADWSEDDTVIFGTLSSGLWRVSSEGGTPVALTNPDAARGGGTHGWPQILSDGTKVLFAVATDAGPRLALLHLDTGKWSMLESFGLVDGGQHLPGGFLLYSQLGRLLVAPVNSETLERSGPPASVSDTMEVHVGASHALRKAWVVVSPAGHMAFVSATATGGVDQLVWVGRDGSAQPITNDVGFFSQPRFSPDGQRLAVVRTPDLWVYGVERPTRARLTGGSASEPVWSWDSRRIIFASNRAGPVSLYWVPADGSADAELLRSGDYALFPHSISRDGKTLAFYELNPSSFRDIWMLPLGGNAEPDSFVVTSFNERSPVFSPDGNSVAYVSDQAGRDEIYVASFPGPGGRVPVSTDGGTEPVWSRDGRELFYRNGDQLLVVQALEDGSFGTPLVLFTGQYKRGWPLSGVREYDVSADGQRFVMVRANPDAGTLTRVHVVLNWLVEIPDLLGRVN